MEDRTGTAEHNSTGSDAVAISHVELEGVDNRRLFAKELKANNGMLYIFYIPDGTCCERPPIFTR